MREVIYAYNSGEISSDGPSVIIKRDRQTAIAIKWSEITKVESSLGSSSDARFKNTGLGSQSLIFRGAGGDIIEEFLMPNSRVLEAATAAISSYMERQQTT